MKNERKSIVPAITVVVVLVLLAAWGVWQRTRQWKWVDPSGGVHRVPYDPSKGWSAAPTGTPSPSPSPTPQGKSLIQSMKEEAARAEGITVAELEARIAAEEAEASASAPRRELVARLAARGGGEATSVSALVGITAIDPADAADAEEHFLAGDGAASGGPSRLEDLANVVQWIGAPVTPEDGGVARVGPVEVPPAPLYRIAAWERDHRLHLGEFIPPLTAPAMDDAETTVTLYDAGTLTAHEPTRLLVRLLNNAPGDPVYEVRLARVPDPAREEEAAALQPLLEFIAPDLLNAYRGDAPMVLAANAATTLSPLLPDRALTLTLRTTAGAEAEPVEVSLVAGATNSVDIDLAAIFGEEADLSYDLLGTLYRGDPETPLVGARVELIDAPIPASTTTDDRGEFRVAGLPAGGVTTRFSVTPAPAESGRPIGPARREYETRWSAQGLDRADLPTPIEHRASWVYPVYRWLVLDLPKADADSLRAVATFPYPIYVLQYRAGDGLEWATVPADEFLHEQNAIAVSLDDVPTERGGRFRMLVATSAYCALPTSEAIVRADNHEVHVRLDEEARRALAERRPASLKLVEAANAIPLGGARVQVASFDRSLPPSDLHADDLGNVELGPATQRTLEIRVAAPGFEPRRVTVELVDDGPTIVEVPRAAP